MLPFSSSSSHILLPPPSSSQSNSLFACPIPVVAPHPPSASVLTLNSIPEFHFLDAGPHSDHLQGIPAPDFSAPFDAFSSSSFLSTFGKKRFPDDPDPCSDDRRHKRMVKNRESATRSRARRQAYINELEQEVAHLMEENARLRRHQQQQCFGAYVVLCSIICKSHKPSFSSFQSSSTDFEEH